jgi:hypothetical protein
MLEERGESSCGYIQPVDSEELQKLEKPNVQKVIEKLFPTYEDKSRITLAAGLAVGALVAFGGIVRFSPRAPIRFRRFSSLGLGQEACCASIGSLLHKL